MNDIAAMAEKILVMEKGSLIMEGTSREIFSHRDELNGMGLAVPDIIIIFSFSIYHRICSLAVGEQKCRVVHLLHSEIQARADARTDSGSCPGAVNGRR